MIPTWLIITFAVLIILQIPATAAAIFAEARRKREEVIPVEYYPPEGFSPLDVMAEYYSGKAKLNGLFNPLMLYWADKGYIKIEEDGKRGLILTKLKDLPPVYKDTDERYKIEHKLFYDIFNKTNVFYTLTAPSGYNVSYKEFVTECKNNIRKTVTSPKTVKVNAIISAYGVGIALLLSIVLGAIRHDNSFLMTIFPIFGLIAVRFMPQGIFKYLFMSLWGGIPLMFFVLWQPAAVGVVFLSAVLLSFAIQNIFLSRLDIRREENLKIYARCEGFKRFLLHARLAELEMLVAENPDYYFDILPYCYVFGITEKVKVKFDLINLDNPAWYLNDESIGDFRDSLIN